jgi:hypothetical protein
MPSALVPNPDWQKRELQGINASASFFSLLDAKRGQAGERQAVANTASAVEPASPRA